MLIVGVIWVRQFFRDQNADDFINSSMLKRHAVSFGLYLMSTSVWALAAVMWNLSDPRNQKVKNFYSCVTIADLIIQFLAQLLLCEILWGWGTKTVDETLD